MRQLAERTAFWAMDTAMCMMMNVVQWRRRGDVCSLRTFSDYITEHAALTRQDYYRMPAISGSVQSEHFLAWDNPLPSGHVENDRTHVSFYPAKSRNAPVLLLLHALMSANDSGYRRVADWFNHRGWSVAFPHLPYHYSRRPRRLLNGELAVTADLVRNAHTLRQAVIELRQLMALLRARGIREFGILGMSYGGWAGALLSFLESDLRFLSLVQPIVNTERAVWENPGARSLRSSLRRQGHVQGNTVGLSHLGSPLHGVPLCDPKNIFITAGVYDRVSPAVDLEDIARRWPGAQLLKVNQGHFGYRALPATLRALEPIVRR